MMVTCKRHHAGLAGSGSGRILPVILVALIVSSIGSPAFAQATQEPPMPPDAPREPVSTTTHGDTLVDEYAWIRQKEDPRVIEYLEAENAYADELTRHLDPLKETLYEQMLARIKEDDADVPYEKDGYFYYSRTEQGKPYPIRCRRAGSLEAPEQVILDVNERARGREYCDVTGVTVSPDGRLLAWLEDTTGYEQCDLLVKDLQTGAIIESGVTGLGPWSLAWANDNKTLFYTRQDQTNRPDRVYRHVIGTDPSEDQLIHHEPDGRFFVGIERTRSGQWLLLGIGSNITSEYHVLDADDPTGSFRMVAPREHGVEYSIQHSGDHFYILTNLDATNFRLMQAPVQTPGREHWVELIGHDPEVYLLGVQALKDWLLIQQRRGGYRTLGVMNISSGQFRLLEFPEAVSTARLDVNEQFDTDEARFAYTSMVTPPTIYSENLRTSDRRQLKQREVLGGYDPADYRTIRLEATGHDGVKIPISLVCRKDVQPDGANPAILYGYGSYGASMDPYFSSNRLSLLDRGVVFAIGHIRGGSEMGRQWYEDGKFLKKRNTFEDFISCAEELVSSGWAAPDRLAIEGGSAGGLLIGAVINMRPELFCAAHAAVPFVDVMNTMMDPTIPLTVIEYDEWGNPGDRAYYEYMKSYSPYDNVAAQEYPDLLVTAGLNDPRVHYWEPAKWVARMRDRATGDRMLILKTNMGAGHGGSSGRYERLREIAFENAFLLDRLGATGD